MEAPSTFDDVSGKGHIQRGRYSAGFLGLMQDFLQTLLMNCWLRRCFAVINVYTYIAIWRQIGHDEVYQQNCPHRISQRNAKRPLS
eukprot:scaffold121953_cov20-Prasinocladus_malaysianus.AAC.3